MEIPPQKKTERLDEYAFGFIQRSCPEGKDSIRCTGIQTVCLSQPLEDAMPSLLPPNSVALRAHCATDRLYVDRLSPGSCPPRPQCIFPFHHLRHHHHVGALLSPRSASAGPGKAPFSGLFPEVQGIIYTAVSFSQRTHLSISQYAVSPPKSTRAIL